MPSQSERHGSRVSAAAGSGHLILDAMRLFHEVNTWDIPIANILGVLSTGFLLFPLFAIFGSGPDVAVLVFDGSPATGLNYPTYRMQEPRRNGIKVTILHLLLLMSDEVHWIGRLFGGRVTASLGYPFC